MLDIIAPAGPQALWTTILLTVLLGGAAAYAAGAAVARTWRPASRLIFYALLLAAAFGFLDYALFENPVIPGGRIVEDLALLASAPGAALADLPRALAGLGVNFIFMLAVALFAFRLTRVRQITTQYGFAFVRRGLLSFAEAPEQAG
jgi:hypothetical protein